MALPDAVAHPLDWGYHDQRLRQHPTDVDVYSDCLEATRRTLEAGFRSGVSVVELVHGRAAVIDRLLTHAWQGFGLEDVPELALVAVGGYGRGELHPGSDVDLMLLHGAGFSDEAGERIGQFLTFLWDIGLEVGHSVRGLDDCMREAERDITVATNLMEARLLAGDADPMGRLAGAMSPEHVWGSQAFFTAKLAEQDARHHRFGDTAYRLEPNLKESPGGLRDIQMIGWVTHRHFGAGSLHELVEHEFLNETEYRDLIDGQTFLWRVRFALHTLTGRKEDRLLFDHQRALAGLLGFSDQRHNLAVEQFMQQYFRTVMELQRLNEILLQHFKEAMLSGGGDVSPAPINRRFQARHGYLETVDPGVFARHPPALLEVFLLLEQHPELQGVRASTIRQIRTHRYLIDEKFRASSACRSLFMDILRQPRGVTHQLRRMNRYGILAAYLPAFGMIVGRMQYDLFHAFTVDEHTLFVIRNLRRFAVPELAHELPHCSHVFKSIPKPELLYLAGLFHDIAKGRGGDHSELGAEDARQFCLDHGLPQYDANLVSWLVRAHLLMSLTAQRRDISDPGVVREFAAQVGNSMRLDYLYLLTVADIRGTNPDLWNSWKDSLLATLYGATQRMLRRGLDNPPDQEELVGEVQIQALELLRAEGMDTTACKKVWAEFEAEYFLRHSADEVAWHTRAVMEADTLPLVKVRQETARGSTEIFVFTEDHPHLFALTTTALTQMGLDIVDARIITTRSGKTLDTYLVLEDAGQPVEGAPRIDEIANVLSERLANPDRPPTAVVRTTPRRLKHFDVPTRIEFGEKLYFNRTVLAITTGDRPGLLSRIGTTLTRCGIKVHNAKIATAGEQADDVFYVTDLQDRPITDKAQQAEIERALREALD
ncbi:[protein-PII] uridylyltransferase [Thioalkalivibrio denitrificans]|uniref:Bifunctional uridylyltransferase/uridylyl-removing enzyme n=1 Tax=Thioalkalivibrio denitrificans TaxID=108003 RepID=A0A1V3NR66_9GAMM|nr:[protein-PII] uridylyltransferase [Thioalkalivibrio denitrificans]